jgi:phenylalanyl-tRNA synthetase alpha chain
VSATPSLQELTGQLEQLEAQAADAIAAASSASDLETLRVGLLGKKGQLSAVLGAMGKLAAEERPLMGQRANVLKELVQGLLSERLEAVKSAALRERIGQETLDVTAPSRFIPPGHRHPLISTIEEIVDILAGLGYRVEEGPEIETDHYNFSALNIPPHHPARDMQDTFYLSANELLRTHTSPVQIRHLEKTPPRADHCPRARLPARCGRCHPLACVPPGGGAGDR